FIVCDYRWKRESNDQYATTGRLVAFFLRREGAGWQATMEVLARPKSGARDAEGRPINFALVDCAVGPDGSLFLTDHNQGVWRLFSDKTIQASPGQERSVAAVPRLVPAWPPWPMARSAVLAELLALPQSSSERSRLREEELRAGLGPRWLEELETSVRDSSA